MLEFKIFDLTMLIAAVILAAMLIFLDKSTMGWGIAIEKMESLEKFMSASSGIMISLLIISGTAIILAFLIMSICRHRKDEDDMMILPFDVATGEDRYSGKAISDLLTAELRRIKRIHEVEAKKIHPIRLESEKFAELDTLIFPPVVQRSEKLDYEIAEVAAVQVGPVWFQIGPLLAALKQLWPGDDNIQIVTGSLQKYGSVINLVAHLEHHEIRSWEVRHKIKPQDGVRDEQIPIMVRDLAFKIAKDLSSEQDSQANTWQGFKYFTEALDAYYLYTLTEDEKELEHAQESCLEAAKVEVSYEKLFDLLLNLGISYLNKKNYVVAEKLIRQALDIKREDMFALIMLGRAYSAQDRLSDKLKCYYKVKYLNPNSTSDWMSKGVALWWLQLYEEALNCFNEVISINPEYATAWFNSGMILSKLDREEEALNCFDKATSLNREDALFWYYNGTSLEKLDRKDEALECYDKVSALDPTFDVDWIKEGDAFMKTGDIKKALMCYEKAIIYSKNIALALTLKGDALIKFGDIERAYKCYMKALDIDPGFSLAGIGLMRLGRYITAKECFYKAIYLNRKDVNAWNGKGTILRIEGKDEDAIKCFEMALEYNPTSTIDYISLIAAHRKLGRENEIANQAEEYKLAHSLIGMQSEYNRACFEAVSGNSDAALALLRTALEKKQEPVLWARRDPDFEFIRDDPRFKALLDEFSTDGKKGPK